MLNPRLGRRSSHDRLEDGSSRWTWIVGGICLALMLGVLFMVSTGDRVRLASHAPPALDGMVTPPITQPAQ